MIWNRVVVFCLLCGCATNATRNTNNIGAQYLGAKYINNPLGEESAPDIDPLIRTDAFDCTTFIETVLADGDKEKLNNIRYKNGVVGILNRNHFFETDWLVNNSNLVHNVTAKYGKTAVRHVVIDKQNWFWRTHKIKTNFIVQDVNLEYLPYNGITKIESDRPMIVLFVADNPKNRDRIGTDIAIVHAGLLLSNGVLRHASKQYGRVIDTDFYDFAAHRAKDKHNLGVILVEINDKK